MQEGLHAYEIAKLIVLCMNIYIYICLYIRYYICVIEYMIHEMQTTWDMTYCNIYIYIQNWSLQKIILEIAGP